MKLAYFSPLNPAPSGISDYSEELVPALADRADLTLMVDGYTPTNPALSPWPVVDDRAYDPRAYDLALYHLGNSPVHASIYRRALAEPGVVVLHDVVLHHLVAWLTLGHGDRAGYVAAMREAYGSEGAALAARELAGRAALNRFDYPLSERVVRAARGVIVHSAYAATAVRGMAPSVPLSIIPHPIRIRPLLAQDAARAQLGLAPDALLVGSFGHVGPTKRTTVLLDALRTVRRAGTDACLWLVGAVSPNFDAPALGAVFGLGGAVQSTGAVSFQDLHTWMAAMDVCVNLRYPTAGETSGAVLRMMGLGKPVIVSRAGWFAELPPGTAAKIDVDDAELPLLTATLERLLSDPTLRAALGRNAREYVLRECTVEQVASRFAEFLEDVAAGRTARWTGPVSSIPSPEPDAAPAPASAPLAPTSPPLPHPPVSASAPLAPAPQPVPTSSPAPADWRDEVASAYSALGLEAGDPALADLARALVELGLND